jgi:hypothetical protein
LISLSPHCCWVDAFDFEALATRAKAASDRGDEDNARHLRGAALSLFQGPFLPHDSDHSWSAPARVRLDRLRERLLAADADP